MTAPDTRLQVGEEDGRSGAGAPSGLRPFGAEPAAQSQAEPPVPNAGELLPCPFCGGDAELEAIEGGGWSVGCQEKALSVHYCMGYQSLTSFATQREAVAAWNSRSSSWQPIESAPKGKFVLVWGHYAGELSGPDPTPDFGIAAQLGGTTDWPGYEWTAAGGEYYGVWANPQCWMPLPAPPASGIEAATADETRSGSAEGESPAPEGGDAQ